MFLKFSQKNSCIRETPNLSTDEDSSTVCIVSAGIRKGADSIFVVVEITEEKNIEEKKLTHKLTESRD